MTCPECRQPDGVHHPYCPVDERVTLELDAPLKHVDVTTNLIDGTPGIDAVEARRLIDGTPPGLPSGLKPVDVVGGGGGGDARARAGATAAGRDLLRYMEWLYGG